MARQEIILGTPPQGIGGDTPRAANMKINAMTTELYGVTNSLANGTGKPLLAAVGVRASAIGLFGVQGGYIGWNGQEVSGYSGEMNFVCNRGSGTGGFTWRSVNAMNTESGPAMTYSYSGVLDVGEISTRLISPFRVRETNGRIGSGAGLYFGWNESGYIGESNFICNNNASNNPAAGGFSWRTVNNINTASGPTMRYTYAGDLSVPGTVVQGSDRRLKINDVEITNGLEKILQVRPVEFDRRSMLTDKEYPFHEAGVIAQELHDVLPILVTPGDDDESQESIWRVNYTGLIPYLISAIKELKSEIEELKAGKTGPA